MIKSTYSKIFSLILVFTAVPVVTAMAQVSLGVDIANRYVWRGFDFGDSPSIQPELSYAKGGFEIGVWGAFATTGNPDGSEVSPWVSYTFDTDAGSFSLIATDYTFPGAGGTWALDGDTHAIELGIGYEGAFNFFAGMFVYGDDDNSLYIELGYDFDAFGIFLGMSAKESAEYGTDGFGVINAGFSYDYDLKISDTFSVGLTSALVLNPTSENLFLVFGVSF